ncbi:MAG: 16S rRNA (guanine(966)-N(2))-methyltransferase RsmD [Candidatus Omnitrophica bacterium]|nr:16S rRNA (guanine(966)-N(2))-methyltransferase RsmD [Candidatus Omnitrophota bacterium]
MKIINGEYSGRNIYMPAHIRPTQNLVRKAVFDIIGHDLTGLSFLELFAGSGAIGFEALSCGASEVVFIEHDPKCVEVIEENLQILQPAARGLSATLLQQDSFFAIKEFARQGKKFHVVFFDPPYGLKLAKKTLKTLMSHDILHPSSYIIAQYDTAERMPEVEGSIRLIKDKVYGSSRLTVYEKDS